MSDHHTGSCQCGAITYTLSAAPLWVGHCQCTNCQKFTGTGHATNMVAPKDALTVSGTAQTYSYDADSGNHMTRYFCPTCASPLYGQSSGSDSLVVIRVGSLDNPGAVEPQAVIYTESRCAWDRVDQDLPSFPGMIKR